MMMNGGKPGVLPRDVVQLLQCEVDEVREFQFVEAEYIRPREHHACDKILRSQFHRALQHWYGFRVLSLVVQKRAQIEGVLWLTRCDGVGLAEIFLRGLKPSGRSEDRSGEMEPGRIITVCPQRLFSQG